MMSDPSNRRKVRWAQAGILLPYLVAVLTSVAACVVGGGERYKSSATWDSATGTITFAAVAIGIALCAPWIREHFPASIIDRLLATIAGTAFLAVQLVAVFVVRFVAFGLSGCCSTF